VSEHPGSDGSNGKGPRPAGDRAPAATGIATVASRIVTAAALVLIAWFAFGWLRQCTPAETVRAGSDGVNRLGDTALKAYGRTLDTIESVLKPTAVTNPLVVLRGEDRTPKLVVYTHAADVAVDLVEDTWYGDTYSRVEARNCRAQFVVPVDRMTDRDIVFVPAGEREPARIIVLAPRPRLDTDMLAIAPESIEFTERNSGLRYARSWLGMDNKDHLVRQVRPRLLEAVGDPAVRARADEAGREFFRSRFAEWLRGDLKLGRDVVVDVRWTE